MRLTNTLRDAFVLAVMQGVPKVDYDEKIRAAAPAVIKKHTPHKLRPLVDNPELDSWLRTGYVHLGGVAVRCVIPEDNYRQDTVYKKFAAAIASDPAIAPLIEANKAQTAKANELRSKLKQVAYSVNTRKALVAALPEFEKYLPPEEGAALRTLPAIANVVSDFVQAGWPKPKAA